MTSKAASLLAVLLLLIVTIPNATAAIKNESENPLVTISTEQGITFVENMNLSGQSTIPAAELVWSLVVIDSVVSTGIEDTLLLSSSTFSNVTMNDDIYDWTLSIPVDSLNCTCRFSIEWITDFTITASTVIFIGTNSQIPYIEYLPSFQTHDSNELKIFEYQVITPEFEPTSNLGLTDSTSFKANICQFSGDSCITESVVVELNHSVNEVGNYDVSIDKLTLDIADGNWLFEIYLRDSFLRYSNSVEMFLTFDTNPPNVTIMGATNAQEEDFMVYSTTVDDGYDSSLVALTWTITEPNGIIRSIHDYEIITDSSIGLILNQSGEWNISVLAIDSVGYFSKQSYIVIVHNIPPEISLKSSVSLDDINDNLVFDVSESWYLDASESTDTLNDINSLTYSWIIGDEIIHSGANLTNLEYDIVGQNSIILAVSDSDGATTQLTIQLQVTEVDKPTKDNNEFAAVITLLIVGLLLITLVMRFRGSDGSFNLPKWDK